ncbi:MAG: hypothetical protein GXN92_01225 [Candidatus Micrarchaeota archaeon]|nr:hypothetical protein [Candidatus Micrarchaeota archaeon]
MKAQISLEVMLLFAMFALIIVAALVSAFELKREMDYKAQSATIFNNLAKLFKKVNSLMLNCPAQDKVEMRFLSTVTLEINPIEGKSGSFVVVRSREIGDVALYTPHSLTEYTVNGSNIILNISCETAGGVIQVG